MNPARSKLIIILALSVIGVLFAVTLLYIFVIRPLVDESQTTPFGSLTTPLDETNIVSMPPPTPPEDWQIYEGPNPPTGLAESFIDAYLAGTVVAPIESWTWQNSMIRARIVFLNSEENSLLLEIIEPEGLDIASERVLVTVECSPEETTSFLNTDMSYLDSNFNMMERIVTGEVLYTYCLNESCSSIGRSCVLIR
jgi:hypothetical protein